MSDLARADDVAINLCRAYQALDIAAFVVRTTDSSDVRLIGLQLPPATIASWLRALADEYERQVQPVVMN